MTATRDLGLRKEKEERDFFSPPQRRTPQELFFFFPDPSVSFLSTFIFHASNMSKSFSSPQFVLHTPSWSFIIQEKRKRFFEEEEKTRLQLSFFLFLSLLKFFSEISLSITSNRRSKMYQLCLRNTYKNFSYLHFLVTRTGRARCLGFIIFIFFFCRGWSRSKSLFSLVPEKLSSSVEKEKTLSVCLLRSLVLPLSLFALSHQKLSLENHGTRRGECFTKEARRERKTSVPCCWPRDDDDDPTFF